MPGLHRRWRGSLIALALAALFALLATPALAERPPGAGLVVQWEDGETIYVYVQFDEPAISGIELLNRSGLDIETAGYAGLGEAVCRIEETGCPSRDCFCQSYGGEPRWWRYFRLEPDGSWVSQGIGPSSRVVRDGDVDGWLWAAGDVSLPPITVDEIAAIAGVTSEREPETASPTGTAQEPGNRPAAAGQDAGGDERGLAPEETGDRAGYALFAAMVAVILAAGGWVVWSRGRRGSHGARSGP